MKKFDFVASEQQKSGWKGGALSGAAFREMALSRLACWQDEP